MVADHELTSIPLAGNAAPRRRRSVAPFFFQEAR
jgi:hypothetical protein